jgi:GTP cyclohydrolase I
MTTRGVNMPGVVTVTQKFLGRFETDPGRRMEFLSLIRPG